MAVGAPSGMNAAERIVVRHTDGSVNLNGSTDVHLSHGAPSISGREKLGADLKIDFESGDSLLVEDFFVTGGQGDFSRLLSDTDDLLASGLQAPEPELPDAREVREVFPVGDQGSSGQATVTDPEVAGGDQADDADGADWFDPLVMTGAGLASGGALFEFDSGQQSEPGASSGQSAEADAGFDDESIAALVGPDDAIIDVDGAFGNADDALSSTHDLGGGADAAQTVASGAELAGGLIPDAGGAVMDLTGTDPLVDLAAEVDP